MNNSRKIIINLFSEMDSIGTELLLEKGMEFSYHIFNIFDKEIDKASYEFVNEPKRIKNYKLYNFKRYKKRIHKEMEKSNIRQICVYSFLKNDDAFAAFDWLLMADFGKFLELDLSVFEIGIDVDLFEDLGASQSREIIYDICREIIDLIKAKYGLVSNMPRNFMPGGYATGLLGSAVDKLLYDANSWSDGACKHYSNRLRNVHGINFVNQRHLVQTVGGLKLEEWIGLDRRRGEIRKWSDDLLLWTFENCFDWPEVLDWDNDAVLSTRDELEKQTFFPWQEYIVGR